MSITLDEIEGLCREIAETRQEIDRLSSHKKTFEEKLSGQEGKLLEILEASGKTNYDSAVGKFIIQHRTSVRIPPDPEAKELFFGYLRSKDLFDKMISVNSQTLNAFWRAEFELAKEKGEAADFAIPGIGEPVITPTVAFKKK